MTFDLANDPTTRKYSHELQALFAELLPFKDDPSAWEERLVVEKKIEDKVIEAMRDWNLGRSDLYALGGLINLCRNRENPPESTPEIQYLPPPK